MQETPHGSMFSHNERHSVFQLLVNGTLMLCRDGSWVLCEPFPSDENEDKIEKPVLAAKNMGAKFLRVWGGGIFEQDVFYSADVKARYGTDRSYWRGGSLPLCKTEGSGFFVSGKT